MYLKQNRAMVTSIVVGAIIGWFVGVGQLVVMGSWEMFYWSGMPMMPLYNAAGFALYGMILGGSGLFSKRETPVVHDELIERDIRATSHAA